MPDDPGSPADAGIQATPQEGGSQEVPAEESVDWQQRYQDTQSNHDRLLNENQQYQQLFEDPELLARAVKAVGLDEQTFLTELGYGVPGEAEDEEEEVYEDPVDELREQVAALQAETAERTEAEHQAQYEQLADEWFNRQMSEIVDAEGRELSKEEAAAVELWGEANPDDQGVPDYKAGWEQAKAFARAEHAKYLESKRTAGVAAGTAGEESIDWSDPEAAHKAVVGDVEAVLAAEQE